MSEQETNWQDNLPETLRATKLVTESPDEAGFWQRIEEQQSFLGSSIRIPSEEAGDADREEFNQKLLGRVPDLMRMPTNDEELAGLMTKLGQPENVDDYKMPEDSDVDSKSLELALAMAIDGGLTNKQFQKLAVRISETDKNYATEHESWLKDQTDALNKEWGMASEERLKQVVDFVKNSGAPEGLLEKLENKQASAEELLWLHSLMGATSETPAMDGGDATKSSGALTPYEADAQLTEILNNPSHPYHKNSGNPDHPAVKQFVELIKMAG